MRKVFIVGVRSSLWESVSARWRNYAARRILLINTEKKMSSSVIVDLKKIVTTGNPGIIKGMIQDAGDQKEKVVVILGS